MAVVWERTCEASARGRRCKGVAHEVGLASSWGSRGSEAVQAAQEAALLLPRRRRRAVQTIKGRGARRCCLLGLRCRFWVVQPFQGSKGICMPLLSHMLQLVSSLLANQLRLPLTHSRRPVSNHTEAGVAKLESMEN